MSRRTKGKLRRLTKVDRQRRQEKNQRKPKESQHAIRLWAHQHIKGER